MSRDRTAAPAGEPAEHVYRVRGDRVWCDGAELTAVRIRALAARLAAVARVRQEAELRDAHPVGSRVWIRGSRVPHTVTGSTDSPGLAPALRLSGGVIARPDQVPPPAHPRAWPDHDRSTAAPAVPTPSRSRPVPATAPPPRPRMRPPRPWVPDDPPETVLPAWMYTHREPRFPHRVVRPNTPPPPEEPVRPHRPRHRRNRGPRADHRDLIVLAALLGAVLGGYACLAATASLPP